MTQKNRDVIDVLIFEFYASLREASKRRVDASETIYRQKSRALRVRFFKFPTVYNYIFFYFFVFNNSVL